MPTVITITTRNYGAQYEAEVFPQGVVERGGSPDEAVGCAVRSLHLYGILNGPVRIVFDYRHK